MKEKTAALTYTQSQKISSTKSKIYSIKDSGANNKRPRLAPLITPREQEILYLIAYEYSSKEVAAKLFISCDTDISHRKRIRAKLKVKNTAGMIRVAYEQNILLFGFRDQPNIIES